MYEYGLIQNIKTRNQFSLFVTRQVRLSYSYINKRLFSWRQIGIDMVLLCEYIRVNIGEMYANVDFNLLDSNGITNGG